MLRVHIDSFHIISWLHQFKDLCPRSASSPWTRTETATATSAPLAGFPRPTALNPLSMSESPPCRPATIRTSISSRSRTAAGWDTAMLRRCIPRACQSSPCRPEDPFSRINIRPAVTARRPRSRAVRVSSFLLESRALRRGCWSDGGRAAGCKACQLREDRRRWSDGERGQDGAVA